MKQNAVWTADFTGHVDEEGRIAVPAQFLEAVRDHGSVVQVQLTAPGAAAELRERGVSADEVGRIAAVQMADRGRVLHALLAEGALRGSEFVQRAGLSRENKR